MRQLGDWLGFILMAVLLSPFVAMIALWMWLFPIEEARHCRSSDLWAIQAEYQYSHKNILYIIGRWNMATNETGVFVALALLCCAESCQQLNIFSGFEGDRRW